MHFGRSARRNIGWPRREFQTFCCFRRWLVAGPWTRRMTAIAQRLSPPLRRALRRGQEIARHPRLAAKPLRPRLDEFLHRRRADRVWDLRGVLSGESQLVAAEHRHRAFGRRLAGVLSQMPGGALADATSGKRGLAALGIAMIGAAALILALVPSIIMVFVRSCCTGSLPVSSLPASTPSASASWAGAPCRAEPAETSAMPPPVMP